MILLGGLVVGGLSGVAFHDLAGLRPFMPPAFSSGNTLACSDLNAYVDHVADLQDHRIHATTFGIHRQKTIDAVNELYDRARCGAQKDGGGHETYQTLKAVVEPDTNDPRTEAVPSATAVPGVYSPPPKRADNPDAPPAAKPPVVVVHPVRRRVMIVNDGTLDALPPVAPPKQPLDCGPPGINWGVPGCTYPRR